MKTCTKCGEIKALTEFYKRKASRDGLMPLCKTCEKARSKAYYEANPEKAKARFRAWYETPAGKLSTYRAAAKQRNIPFLLTEEQFKSFWQAPCSYCGDEIETIGLDRINNDGPYRIDNVRPCCSPCNASKHAKTLEEWQGRKNV